MTVRTLVRSGPYALPPELGAERRGPGASPGRVRRRGGAGAIPIWPSSPRSTAPGWR
ncbi:hypothetical protein NKH77_18675 [Streptomyces sp. M19]